MTFIVGQKCRLRPLRRSDSQASIVWRNDPAVRDAVMGYRFPVTEVMEQNWYDRVLSDSSGKRASFAIEELEGDTLAGFVHLTGIDWSCRSAQFGIVIGEPGRQNQGIGTEATKLALVYAFDTLNLARVELRVVDDNARARQVYAKFGFVEEGRLRRAAYANGRTADVIVMGLLREEFRRAPVGASSRKKKRR
jgi:RimJ/RimL family protein N-acetyltransferase